MDPARHLTIEALAILNRVGRILVVTGNANRVRSVVSNHDNVEDIMELYKDGAIDEENYIRIASKIIDACDSTAEVAIVVGGHPIVGVSWWSRLKVDSAFGAEIVFIEGLSSVLTVPTALLCDPIEKGCCVVDANRLLLFEYVLNPELDLLVLDVCSTGTRRTHLSNPQTDNAWDLLRAHLLRFYPKNNPALLVRAIMDDGETDIVCKATVHSLDKLYEDISFGTSLWIPGIEPRRFSQRFLRRLLGIRK